MDLVSKPIQRYGGMGGINGINDIKINGINDQAYTCLIHFLKRDSRK